MSKVWFVTGASKGLGLNLVQKLLETGHRVAATSRNEKALIEKISRKNENFLPLAMDLKSEASVKRTIQGTVDHFGTIDVVVNNAGYGLGGAIEELQHDEVQDNFDVNVYGTLHVIRNILPIMRDTKSGQIMNISSLGGFVANFPGYGIYCATKFAVQAITEALQVEVAPLGIKATCISPGYFRTEFLSNESMQDSRNEISDYQNVREVLHAHSHEIHGNQTGDPKKAADVFIELSQMDNPPVHLFLGSDAYQYVNKKKENLQEMMKVYKTLGTSTDFVTV